MSWLRDRRTMFLLYLAVGFAFVPAGLLYALAGLAGWDNWPVAAVCLGFGFLTAHFVWTKLERRLMEGARRSAMGEGQDDPRESSVTISLWDPQWPHPPNSALGQPPATSTQYIWWTPVVQTPRIEHTQAPVTDHA